MSEIYILKAFMKSTLKEQWDDVRRRMKECTPYDRETTRTLLMMAIGIFDI